MEGWNELVDAVNEMLEGTIYTNDMSKSETVECICCAMEKFARRNNLPEPRWTDG